MGLIAKETWLVALLICAGASSRAGAACPTAYADNIAALSAHAHEVDAHAPPFSYAVRTTATYECLSYGTDQTVKRDHPVATAYGTAFAYRRDHGDTLLLTNAHVAEWPAVTDATHQVDGVGVGCKRISDTLAIVDNDHDDYAADDVALTRVVVDPVLDVAVLRAPAPLAIIPWRTGDSAALTPRAAVEVKGFPLGAFRAVNVGKVVALHDHDVDSERDHDDFITDALLAHGGSGSPVLAVSCKTGEFELVGIFHSTYVGASALNAVVSIDQVKSLMTTLQRPARPSTELAIDAAARARVEGVARGQGDPPFFAFGALTASVAAHADGVLVFTLYGPDFPTASRPILVVEDLPSTDAHSFGTLGAVYVDTPAGLRRGALDAATTLLARNGLAGLRANAVRTFDNRLAPPDPSAPRDAFERATAAKRSLARAVAAQGPLVQAMIAVGHAPVEAAHVVVTRDDD